MRHKRSTEMPFSNPGRLCVCVSTVCMCGAKTGPALKLPRKRTINTVLNMRWTFAHLERRTDDLKVDHLIVEGVLRHRGPP